MSENSPEARSDIQERQLREIVAAEHLRQRRLRLRDPVLVENPKKARPGFIEPKRSPLATSASKLAEVVGATMRSHGS